jgi:hypothetical protein
MRFLALPLFCAISLLPSTVSAKENPIAPQCQTAIESGTSRLKAVRGLKLVSQSSYVATEDRATKLPEGRPRAISFSIDGKAANATMRSPKLIESIGTDIIQACSDVSTVTIGVNRSAWIETVGLFEDGSIRLFTCTDESAPRQTRELPYGEVLCSV